MYQPTGVVGPSPDYGLDSGQRITRQYVQIIEDALDALAESLSDDLEVAGWSMDGAARPARAAITAARAALGPTVAIDAD